MVVVNDPSNSNNDSDNAGEESSNEHEQDLNTNNQPSSPPVQESTDDGHQLNNAQHNTHEQRNEPVAWSRDHYEALISQTTINCWCWFWSMLILLGLIIIVHCPWLLLVLFDTSIIIGTFGSPILSLSDQQNMRYCTPRSRHSGFCCTTIFPKCHSFTLDNHDVNQNGFFRSYSEMK